MSSNEQSHQSLVCLTLFLRCYVREGEINLLKNQEAYKKTETSRLDFGLEKIMILQKTGHSLSSAGF